MQQSPVGRSVSLPNVPCLTEDMRDINHENYNKRAHPLTCFSPHEALSADINDFVLTVNIFMTQTSFHF